MLARLPSAVVVTMDLRRFVLVAGIVAVALATSGLAAADCFPDCYLCLQNC